MLRRFLQEATLQQVPPLPPETPNSSIMPLPPSVASPMAPPIGSASSRPLPAHPPAPPTRASPPAFPPLPPKLYSNVVKLTAYRERNAGHALVEKEKGHTVASQWSTSFNRSALGGSHMVVQREWAMTGFSAHVDFVVSADNGTSAYEVAGNTFAILLNVSSLFAPLRLELNLQSSAFLVESLRAEFWHPVDGLVVIEGSLPPPPPIILETLDAALTEAVETTTTAVTAVVAGAVAASVVASLAASLAASVAASTASATGGATASSGAAGGGGGALPLVFGAQRFSASRGLAVKKSPLQTGVADGMGWATGNFGQGAETERRQLMHKMTGRSMAAEGGSDSGNGPGTSASSLSSEALGVQAQALADVKSVLSTLGYVQCAIALLMAFACIWWRFRRNKRYYAERGLTEIERRALYEPRRPVPRGAKFASFPSAFVFPGALLLGFNFFLNGLVQPAFTLASFPSERDVCGADCLAPMLAILALIGVYLILSLLMLIHFHRLHRMWTWVDVEEPLDANDVEDALYRFISKVRVRRSILLYISTAFVPSLTSRLTCAGRSCACRCVCYQRRTSRTS